MGGVVSTPEDNAAVAAAADSLAIKDFSISPEQPSAPAETLPKKSLPDEEPSLAARSSPSNAAAAPLTAIRISESVVLDDGATAKAASVLSTGCAASITSTPSSTTSSLSALKLKITAGQAEMLNALATAESNSIVVENEEPSQRQFQRIAAVLIVRLGAARADDGPSINAAINALNLFMGVFVKNINFPAMATLLDETRLSEKAAVSLPMGVTGSLGSAILERVCHLFIKLPIMSTTMSFHEDLQACLMVLFSTRLHQLTEVAAPTFSSNNNVAALSTAPDEPENLYFFQKLGDLTYMAGPLVHRLLEFAVREFGSELANERAGWFMSRQNSSMSVCARQAVLLLHVLYLHRSSIFRACFQDLRNATSPVGLPVSNKSSGANARASIDESADMLKFPFDPLYRGLTHNEQPEILLLLYTLGTLSKPFLDFVLSRTDIDELVVPILRQVYTFTRDRNNYSQLYIMLSILLILSTDDSYCQRMYEINLSGSTLSWFRDRPLNEASLGNMIILVIMRMMQLNLNQSKDLYVHDNCMAILTNLSRFAISLRPYVCDRFMNLLEGCINRVCQRRQGRRDSAASVSSQREDSSTGSIADQESVFLGVITQLFHMLNTILFSHLRHNGALIYAIMMRYEVIENGLSLVDAPETSSNVAKIVKFIREHAIANNVWRDTVTSANGSPTFSPAGTGPVDLMSLPPPDALMQAINDGSKMFPVKILHSNACQTRYRYEESPTSTTFFGPVVWAMIYSSIPWAKYTRLMV